ETQLGEGGAKISGGERQRIAIARAFLKDAPILVLDEPTSAIDVRTESQIFSCFDTLIAKSTTFIVAHRLSTVRNADYIIVLDEGRIVEYGSPEELLSRRNLFADMYAMQHRVHEVKNELSIMGDGTEIDQMVRILGR